MRTFYIILILFVFFGCARKDREPEAEKKTPKTSDVRVPDFDGKKAFNYLVSQTDFGPRVPGTEAHKRCLAFLRDELSKYAYAVNLQPFTHGGYEGEILSLTNIIASFNPEAQTRILLLAHWDSRPRSDQDPDITKRDRGVTGANDGASGVAVLLETARILKNNPCPTGIDILFTDGEDYGNEGDLDNYFLGAKYFARNLHPGFRPVFGILLDMVGDKQLEILKEPYSLRYAPDVVNLVWTTARELNINNFIDATRAYRVEDDHIPLNEAGIKTIDIIDFSYPDESNRYWHTTEDTPDKCSPESLEAIGRVLIHVIYRYPA